MFGITYGHYHHSHTNKRQKVKFLSQLHLRMQWTCRVNTKLSLYMISNPSHHSSEFNRTGSTWWRQESILLSICTCKVVLFRQELDSEILYYAYIGERRGCVNVEKKWKQEPATSASKEKKMQECNWLEWSSIYINTPIFKLLSPLTLCAIFDHSSYSKY
jgi:hypothetical protein